MQDPPQGWPRISSAVFYREPRKAIDFLCEAFGFAIQELVEGEDGAVHHSQLVLGGGLVMVSGERTDDAAGGAERRSPASVDGANTQAMMVFVDDADAHCVHARAAGATIAMEPATIDYGEGYWVDRSYQALDCEGHGWWFVQRISG